jgi:hypothetical protein
MGVVRFKGDFMDHLFGNAASIVAVVWIAIFAIVFIAIYFSYRERTKRYHLIETLAEKGQPIPPELLSDVRGNRGGGSVQSGIYMICVGIALFVFFWAMSGGGVLFDGQGVPNWLPFIGIFPFMIGVARLISALFGRSEPKSQ